MAATCQMPVEGQSCDVLAVGRCGTCNRPICASHAVKTGTGFGVVVHDQCVSCRDAARARSSAQDEARGNRLKSYEVYVSRGVLRYLEASSLSIVEVMRVDPPDILHPLVKPSGMSIVAEIAWRRKHRQEIADEAKRAQGERVPAWYLGQFELRSPIHHPRMTDPVGWNTSMVHYFYPCSGGWPLREEASTGTWRVVRAGGEAQMWANRLKDLVGPPDWDTIYSMT